MPDSAYYECMRRKEFAVDFEGEGKAEIEAFLNEMTFGFMATTGSIEGSAHPHITPLNYLFHNGCFYMHGSRIGQKMKDIGAGAAVTFAVAKEYSIIPSFFSGAEIACPATAFFKSVIAYGFIHEETDLQRKSDLFQLFMERLQPEGRFRPFSTDDPEYLKNLRGVSLLQIKPERITAKFKFGQNQKERVWNLIADNLKERNTPESLQTLAEMEKRCPFGH